MAISTLYASITSHTKIRNIYFNSQYNLKILFQVHFGSLLIAKTPKERFSQNNFTQFSLQLHKKKSEMFNTAICYKT